MFVVVGIDTSLTGTGLCRLAIQDDGSVQWETDLISTRGHLNDSLFVRSRRIRGIVDRAMRFTGHPDVAVIEGPSYGSKGAAAHDRSGLWWTVMHQLLDRTTVLEVTPAQRMKFATGKGNVDKDVVLAAAIRRWPAVDITNNNVADAVILAAVGALVLGQESEPQTPKYALDVVETLVKQKAGAK